MIYVVNITSEDGNVIELGKELADSEQGNTITNVEIFLDTSDDASRQKSLEMLARIEISGNILADSSESKTNCKALFDWAKSLDKSQWYREVVIEVKTDNENVFRTYRFEKMFVLDYIENYSLERSNNPGTFKLKLMQKENNFKTIETY